MQFSPLRGAMVFGLALFIFILGSARPTQASITEFPSVGPAGFTSRVSVDSIGNEANGASLQSVMSADGRYVVFFSEASNLVPDDTNDALDIFVYDRHTGSITRVSVASDGTQANGDSYDPTISGDGQFVAFVSEADNLVADDTNGQTDVFVHNLQTGETTRVSVASGGVQATGGLSLKPSLSFDGQFVAFHSEKTDLVPNDTNNETDIFVHNRFNGNTIRISVDSDGIQANDFSENAVISANGQFIAFALNATNLVPGDTNNSNDVFVRDRQNNTTTRVSVSSTGVQGDRGSGRPTISADGRYIAFQSSDRTLIDGEPFDANLSTQIYRHDRDTGETIRVSLDPNGAPANNGSQLPSISGDGQFITFASVATNLVSETFSGQQVFLHHVPTQGTVLVSASNAGQPSNGNDILVFPQISLDGRYVTYHSAGSNLVPNDLNGERDVFVFTRAFPVYLPTLQR